MEKGVKITREVLDGIVSHARKGAPLEACGYLAERGGLIVKHFELTNADQSRDHFSFDPREQFEALRKARAEGLELRAVYHSHPASPARPSAEDIKLAYDPQLSYVIVSLAADSPDVKSFRIKEARVSGEPLEIVDEYHL